MTKRKHITRYEVGVILHAADILLRPFQRPDSCSIGFSPTHATNFLLLLNLETSPV